MDTRGIPQEALTSTENKSTNLYSKKITHRISRLERENSITKTPEDNKPNDSDLLVTSIALLKEQKKLQDLRNNIQTARLSTVFASIAYLTQYVTNFLYTDKLSTENNTSNTRINALLWHKFNFYRWSSGETCAEAERDLNGPHCGGKALHYPKCQEIRTEYCETGEKLLAQANSFSSMEFCLGTTVAASVFYGVKNLVNFLQDRKDPSFIKANNGWTLTDIDLDPSEKDKIREIATSLKITIKDDATINQILQAFSARLESISANIKPGKFSRSISFISGNEKALLPTNATPDTFKPITLGNRG